MTKVCVVCGVSFNCSHNNRECCSRACGGMRRRRRVVEHCQRDGCTRTFEVRASQQRRPGRAQRYCSRSCAAQVVKNCNKVKAAQSVGGKKGAKTRFAEWWSRAMAGLKGVSPQEAFKAGYLLGYRRKMRQVWLAKQREAA